MSGNLLLNGRLAVDVWSVLLATPIEQLGPDPCYEMTRRALASVGVLLPETAAAGLNAQESLFRVVGCNAPLRPFDVLVIRGHERPHLGVVVSLFRVLHTFSGGAVRIDPVRPFLAGGKVDRVLRAKALGEREPAGEPQ